MPDSYPLSGYLASVKRLVQTQIPPVWVTGVISQLREKGRAVYMTLAEYEEDSVIPKASLDIVIFQPQYVAIQNRLGALPAPFQLKIDLKVKVLIEADFYIPQGKFNAHITDIDPSFSLGEIAVTKAKIWDKLVKENLHRLNGSLPMSLLPLKVGLITSENSAAYNDFAFTLKSSGFAFDVVPVWAKMQGENTERDIITALGKLREHKDLDVVCIVRGGGARTDLVFFDSEALCRAVALFPTPVLTGIGHEIDQSLLDKVAYKFCITPTDCAKFLIARAEMAADRLKTLSLEFASLAQSFTREKDKLNYKLLLLKNIVSKTFAKEAERISRNSLGLERGVVKIMDFQKKHLELLQEKIKSADPKAQLAKGYTITQNGLGQVIRSSKEVLPQTEIITTFADGTVKSLTK